MRFNFNKMDDEMIKYLLKEDDENIIIAGSFSLYKVHFKNKERIDEQKIIIKDLDLDIPKKMSNLNKEEFINQVRELVKEKLYSKLYKIEECENIYNFDVKIIYDFNVQEREYNKNNYGIKLAVEFEDMENDEKRYFYFDIGIEGKEFEIEKHIIKTDDGIRNIYTYSLEKTLADKYLALYKRFKILTVNNSNNKDYKNNFYKMSKDLYDINYINTNDKTVRKSIVLKNINKMTDDKWINNNTIDFILFCNKIINENSSWGNKRGVGLDLSHYLNEFKELTISNENKL